MDNLEFFQRVPPHSRDLEVAALSAILQSPVEAMPLALELLSPAAFYLDAHKALFKAMTSLHKQGSPPDTLTVIAHLKGLGQLAGVGGESYLYQLVAAVPDASLIENHSQQIHSKQLLRNLITCCTDLITAAYEPAAETEELLERAERMILAVDTGLGQGEFYTTDDAVRSFIGSFIQAEEIQADGSKTTKLIPPPVISSGYADVDKYTGGFRKGEFIVIGARPSVGKTAIALNFAFHAAKMGKPVGIFSLEMSKEQLASRLLAMQCSIAGHTIRAGKLNEEQLARVVKAHEELCELPIWFDDQADTTVRSLRGRARRMQQKHGIELIMVDYLQLVTADISRRGEHNRVNEITEVSRTLKAIARELNIPVIVASQLSRNSEWRQDKRPMLSDLRDSGSIEQDADVVILLFRSDYQNQVAEDTGKSKVEIDIAKNRNGRTGKAYLTLERDYTRYIPNTKDDNTEVTI
jgi:replicative DNA helicase